MDIFYELRKLTKPEDRIAVDLAQHLQVRHGLGPTLVICDNPHALMSAVRKQWLRLARNLQRKRASTINAEEILRHTKAIMHMQNAQFTIKSPREIPDATVYFQSSNEELRVPKTPLHCTTIYLVSSQHLPSLAECANDALVVLYNTDTPPTPLRPRFELEQAALKEWEKLTTILHRHDIDPTRLSLQDMTHQKTLDQALDALIVDPDEFLQQAYIFQKAIDAAQPVQQISSEYKRIFEATSRLAYRVNTLTPYTKPLPLATALADNENFFLRDSGSLSESVTELLVCERLIYRHSATI